MPKVTDTRKQRAEMLFTRLQRGPSISPDVQGKLTVSEVEQQYKIWFRSWIREELVDLIPELKKVYSE